MTTPSVLGNSAQVFYNLTGSGSYTEIANIKSIGTPEPEYMAVPVSGLTDATELKAIGTLDNKQFTFQCFQTAANWTDITVTLPGVSSFYKVLFSDTHGWTFQGFLKNYKAKVDRNQALIWDVTVEISGALTAL